MNLRATLRVLSRLLGVLAAAQVVPLVCCLWYGETRDAGGFALSVGIAGVAALLMALAGRGAGETYRREGILIVVGGWVLASFFGAIPYLTTGTLTLPADALFESASGFTTTGASVMTDIEAAGRGILFWRGFTQWLGGMGIIVLFVALLPELGPGARFLYKLEVPGPTAATLHPRVRDTANVLWRIYLALSAAQTLLLLVAGMDLYDALAHTFTTMSTGGFSPRNASIAAFESPWVHLVIIVFMVLAGVNFSLYYGLRRHRGRNLLADPELRVYLALLGIVSVLVAANLVYRGVYASEGRAFLDALFQVASILTTTGYATADFALWPSFSQVLLAMLLFVGGCAGSTGGGPKVMRYVVGLEAARREVRLIFSPSSVLAIFVGGKAVPNHVVRSVTGFFFLYFSLWGLGAVLLSIGNVGLETAATASIAVLGNIGPGLAGVGPTENFAFFAGWQKALMVVLMWLGRLEVYAIAAVATVAFWRR